MFNFGPSFIRWIKTIYFEPTASVKNNGHISNNFNIYRGIKQGCPVSALLFNLCVEVLAIKIRSSNDLKGLNIGYNRKIKLSQYADDTVLFLNNEAEMGKSFEIIENFGNVSGLRLNKHKCEGYWLGVSKYRQQSCTMFDIKWPLQIRYLGIYLGYSENLNIDKNWETKISKIENIINRWKNRKLTLFGKIQVIKSFAISQLTLPASVLQIPEYVIPKVNKILYSFLWGSKDKVKRLKTIKNIKDGGLNMIDLESYFYSLKATWINRILNADPESQCWAQILLKYMKNTNLNINNYQLNFDDAVHFPEIYRLPKFYSEVLKTFNRFRFRFILFIIVTCHTYNTYSGYVKETM